MPKNLIDVESFMNRERLASFATVDSKSEPYIVPVFFTYEDGRVYVQTSRDSAKVRNLKGNNNVAVAVYRGEEAVIMRGKGRVIGIEKRICHKNAGARR
jgi:nitroimidazol reductase NimA-like FMN-containing flavoprotein (pyridoxamine 5'-phosphate oxidase superfamily)